MPRPCLRATIHKTEVRGPKTAPFVVYLIHVRTAFTVRGLARRYSDFVQLDAEVRELAQTLNGAARVPVLPGKRLMGQLSVEVVLERRRQLQGYGFRVLGVGAVRSLSHHTHSRPRPHAHTTTHTGI